MSNNRINLVRSTNVAVRQARPTDGADQRVAKVYALNSVYNDWILFMKDRYPGLDETRSVYGLQCILPKDRGAHYSGCSPTMIVKICSPHLWNDHDKTDLYIPIYCLPKSVAGFYYPDFTGWCLSKIRSAKFWPASGWEIRNEAMDFSTYERLETIFGALTGTLSSFFSTDQTDWVPRGMLSLMDQQKAKDEKAEKQDIKETRELEDWSRRLALLMLAVNHTPADLQGDAVMWQLDPTKQGGYNAKTKVAHFSDVPIVWHASRPAKSNDDSKDRDALIHQLLTRDTDETDAFTARIRKIKSGSELVHFFELLTKAGTHNPKIFHMAVWPRLEYFAFGMLLSAIPPQVLEEMRSVILVAMFNRMLRRIPLYGKGLIAQPLTLEELVKNILDATPKLMGYLRYWAFTVQFILHVKAMGSTVMDPIKFGPMLKQLKSNILACPSIQALCLTISPQLGGMYTAETLADLFLTVHTQAEAAGRKFLIIESAQVNSKCESLARQLKANQEVVEKQAKLMAERAAKEAAADKERESQLKSPLEAPKRQTSAEEWEVVSPSAASANASANTHSDEKRGSAPEVKDAVVGGSPTATALNVFLPNPLATLCEPWKTNEKGEIIGRHSMDEQLKRFWGNLAARVEKYEGSGNYRADFEIRKIRHGRKSATQSTYRRTNFASATWRENEYLAHVKHSLDNDCRRRWIPKWSHFDDAKCETRWVRMLQDCESQVQKTQHDLQQIQRKRDRDLYEAKCRAEQKDAKDRSDAKAAEEDDIHESEGIKDRGVPLQIKPFEPSCVWWNRICVLTGATEQCLICFSGRKKLVELHPKPASAPHSTAHRSCEDCQKQLKAAAEPMCPFCRASLH